MPEALTSWGRFSLNEKEEKEGEGNEKWGEGKKKIKERATFLRLKYFKLLI